MLEVGAGTGAHLGFVRHSFDKYVLTDHNRNTLDIAKENLGSSMLDNLAFEVQSGLNLDFSSSSFNRVVAGHVLEHIYYPHLAIKEWIRVLKDEGTLSVLIPTDPGVAWRLGCNLGPRRNAMARNIAYDYVMAREHVNPCNNLIALLKHYFPEHQDQYWPFSIPSIDVNLFYIFHGIVRK